MTDQNGMQNTGSSEHNHGLGPNVIKDTSTGGSGVWAGALAAEDEGLLSQEALKAHGYGSVAGGASEEPAADDGEYTMPSGQLYSVIAGLFMASYLAALDTTVVTTLLSVIASDLNALGNISWIATAYLLSCSAFQPLFGKLSDIFGRKACLLTCVFFFTVGCLICATNSLLWLIFGRFITGIGGSGLTTLGTITMSDLVPLRDRGLYQGIANVFFSLGAASGGIIGGFVADWIGWKYVFLLQVPLSIAVGFVVWRNLNLPAGSPGLGVQGSDFKDKLKRIDFVGSSFLVFALVNIMLAASLGGREIAYSSPIFIGLCFVAALSLTGFVYTEMYGDVEPILPIELMADRTILSSSLANWFYTMGIFTNLYYIPLYFNSVIGVSASHNGLRLVPNFLAISFGSVGAGLYMKHTGRYYKLTVVVGIIAIAGVFRIFQITKQILKLEQFIILIPSGFSYSAMLTVTLLSLIAAVPIKYQACTTSIQYTFRATGSTLGLSIASAIFQNILLSSLTTKVHEVISDYDKAEKIISKALENTNYINEAPKIVRSALIDSYASGCKGAFTFSFVIVVLGVISSLFMKEHVLHSSLQRD